MGRSVRTVNYHLDQNVDCKKFNCIFGDQKMMTSKLVVRYLINKERQHKCRERVGKVSETAL